MEETLNQRWAATLVGAMVEGGVRHVVIAPGSRSTPLVLACTARPELQTFSVLNECSAAFFALGLARASQLPAAVLCTSGTAAAHCFPAVIEARAQGTPLLLLTADRPWVLHGFGAPQTAQQGGLFGAFPVDSVDFPTPTEGRDIHAHLAALTARALARAVTRRGPVHFNVPFDEPLAPSTADTSQLRTPPPTRFTTPRLQAPLAHVTQAVLQAKRGLILLGLRDTQDGFPSAIHQLGRRLNFPVLAEATSNARYGFDESIAMYDVLLQSPHCTAWKPDVILRFGAGLTAQKTQEWFDGRGARIFVFTEGEGVVDPRHCAEEVLRCEFLETCQQLPHTSATPESWWAAWQGAERRLRARLERACAQQQETFTEAFIARECVRTLPSGVALVIANSMPIRDVNAFAPTGAAGLRVFANRGTNGIDGTTSTALGISAAAAQPTVLLTGDVALLHDISAWVTARRLRNALTTVLINNNGGGIFHFLPIATATAHFETFFATPHGVDVASVAALGNANLHRPRDASSFRAALTTGLKGGLHLIEIQTRRDANPQAQRTLLRALHEGGW